jgi:hypothetical protein
MAAVVSAIPLMEQNECSQSMRVDTSFPETVNVEFENGDYQSVPTTMGERHSCILHFSRVPYGSFFTSVAKRPGETPQLIDRFVAKYQNKCYELKYKSTRRRVSLRKPYMKKTSRPDQLREAIQFVNKNANMYYISNIIMPTAESAFPIESQMATVMPSPRVAWSERDIPVARQVSRTSPTRRRDGLSRGGKKSRKRHRK